MKRRASKFIFLTFTLGILSNACSTTPPRRPRPPLQQPIEKEGQKVPTGEIQTSPGSVAVPPSPAGEDIPGLYTRVTNTAEPLSEDDLMKATQLYPAPPNSMEEAVFVVTQMRILRTDWERKTSFQTQDLHTQKTADNTAGLSLERTFADLQVDLASVIRSNPHLKNKGGLTLAKQLVETTKNSDSYKAGVSSAIKTVGAQWPELLVDAAPQGAESPAATPTPPAATGEAPAAPAAVPTSAAPNSNLDLMGSDTLLIAAQKLADKRDYKAALDHVSRIKKEDPFYAQAQEKTKQYSNRAVKDLRAKAAEAFSNAAPMNDSNAKANYLRQAKTYLEQALKDFPTADGLDSVKENLEAVNRGLDSLDKTGT
ncbi:MAG: hypothetical protein EOP10_06590 [Proteobacteria bacterium]|nr:MAG: hypothetical protein EOP10_06590 [Pseudomonadota bacterium]